MPAHMPASLSVSLVVYDLDKKTLSESLRSLAEASERAKEENLLESCKLTIVDNGGNGTALSTMVPAEATFIENARNVGFGSAHNQVIRQSQSTIHLVLNPDVIMAPDSVVKALQHFEQNPGVVACGPLGTDEEGRNAYLSKRYPTITDLFLRGFAPRFLSRLFDHRLARYEYRDLPTDLPSDVVLLSGCCLFIRADPLKLAGGFNEDFFLYFEDYDLCLRLRKAGRLVYEPAIRIVHHGGNSARKGWRHVIMFSRSAFRFFRLHGWRLV